MYVKLGGYKTHFRMSIFQKSMYRVFRQKMSVSCDLSLTGLVWRWKNRGDLLKEHVKSFFLIFHKYHIEAYSLKYIPFYCNLLRKYIYYRKNDKIIPQIIEFANECILKELLLN